LHWSRPSGSFCFSIAIIGHIPRPSRSQLPFTIVGDLTIKDVTREVQLALELDGVVKDPWGGTRLAVTASTEIDREDWGMTWNAALEAGGVVVSKKVRIEIESEAVLQA
jgi:polyisoprenoid-binding protein YceI